MNQACSAPLSTAPAAPRVGYVDGEAASLLGDAGTLAVIGFGRSTFAVGDDPRFLHVTLPGVDGARLPFEHWHVDAEVTRGRDEGIGWACGGGWLFAYLHVPEAEHGGDIGRCAEHAYHALCRFVMARAETFHPQRIWHYLDHINAGDGDAERYKQFCAGRVRGMDGFFDAGFPAATAIGQPEPTGRLTVYCLAARHSGRRVENPRQMSAWRYPPQYGRSPPSFTRAMLLPAHDALAISGTAAITGHESRHADDLTAQLSEIRANLGALSASAGLPAELDATAPLKVYVRHREDAPVVADFLDRHMPDAPRVLLQGDICRRELRVEIDGWQYA